jgi:acetylornithine deacetylase
MDRRTHTLSGAVRGAQVKCAVGSLNQLPPWTEISGDVRLTPFYEVEDLKAAINGYVADLNADLGQLPTFGPCSKYEIEGAKGSLEMTWGAGYMEGIACSLTSEGYFALLASTEEVLGEVKPYSIGGSLPLVRNMQRGGFDVQMTGESCSSSVTSCRRDRPSRLPEALPLLNRTRPSSHVPQASARCLFTTLITSTAY